MTQVHRILRPRDEMINISRTCEVPVAVETATVLKFDKDWTDSGQNRLAQMSFRNSPIPPRESNLMGPQTDLYFLEP